MALKRGFIFFMCLVLTVTACVYLPADDQILTASALYSDSGHINFTRTCHDKILITQPLAQTAVFPAISNNASSGFEAGPGLTYGGQLHNCTANIEVGGGYLTLINYSSATAAEKALLDVWGNNRGAHIEQAFKITREVHANGWGYDTYITWPTAMDLSTMSHIYLQFWITDSGTTSQYSSDAAIANNRGRLWFNLIGDDSDYSVDGWNWPVDLKNLDPDADGKINTAHYYTFPVSAAEGKFGTLKSVKKMVIRFNSLGTSGSVQNTSSPAIILGKFMMYNPSDNIQVGGAINNNGLDGQQAIMYQYTGKNAYNAYNKLRWPYYKDSRSTFIVYLRYGTFDLKSLGFWPWRFTGTYNITDAVDGTGGAYGGTFNRTNTKYLSSTRRFTYTP